MSQSDYNIANADGATVRADINSQLDAIGSQNSGSTAPPVTFPYMRWFDTANQQLKERNGANTAWRIVAEVVAGELVPYSAGESVETRFARAGGDLKWLSMPVGMPFGIRDDLAGADVPPNDSADYRYIKLTAGQTGTGAYNEGVLISETITGSAPLVVATAVIDYADSPINGETVNLWNTENRYPMPGTSAGTVGNDQMQQITASADTENGAGLRHVIGGATGAFSLKPGSAIDFSMGQTTMAGTGIDFDSANSPDARVGDHTNVKHQQVTYYMRIA